MDWADLVADLQRIVNEVIRTYQRESDARRFPSLEEWLQADIAGSLAYGGAEGGSSQIPDEIRDRLRRQARERERRRTLASERRCGCGATFIPERTNARHCPACRELARRLRGSRAEAR